MVKTNLFQRRTQYCTYSTMHLLIILDTPLQLGLTTVTAISHASKETSNDDEIINLPSLCCLFETKLISPQGLLSVYAHYKKLLCKKRVHLKQNGQMVIQ